MALEAFLLMIPACIFAIMYIFEDFKERYIFKQLWLEMSLFSILLSLFTDWQVTSSTTKIITYVNGTINATTVYIQSNLSNISTNLTSSQHIFAILIIVFMALFGYDLFKQAYKLFFGAFN